MPSESKTETQLLWQSVRQIETNIQQMVDHVNQWVAKMQGIDSVAYAALLLHEGKEFVLDAEKVAKNQQAIQDVLTEMGRFRAVRQAEADAEAKAELNAKKTSKKIKVSDDGASGNTPTTEG